MFAMFARVMLGTAVLSRPNQVKNWIFMNYPFAWTENIKRNLFLCILVMVLTPSWQHSSAFLQYKVNITTSWNKGNMEIIRSDYINTHALDGRFVKLNLYL